MKILASAVVALMLAGCATMVPPEQPRYQAMADEVTSHFKTGKVFVMAHRQVGSVYRCQNSLIELSLIGDDPTWSLAHELGHHRLGHCGGRGLQQEMAANQAAVEHLQVWGFTEASAVLQTLRHLYITKRWWNDHSHQAKPTGYSDHDFCAEAADILQHFPSTPRPVRTGAAPGWGAEVCPS